MTATRPIIIVPTPTERDNVPVLVASLLRVPGLRIRTILPTYRICSRRSRTPTW